MTKKELQKLMKDVKTAQGWDLGGDEEDQRYVDKAAESWEKIEQYLKENVLPEMEASEERQKAAAKHAATWK